MNLPSRTTQHLAIKSLTSSPLSQYLINSMLQCFYPAHPRNPFLLLKWPLHETKATRKGSTKLCHAVPTASYESLLSLSLGSTSAPFQALTQPHLSISLSFELEFSSSRSIRVSSGSEALASVSYHRTTPAYYRDSPLWERDTCVSATLTHKVRCQRRCCCCWCRYPWDTPPAHVCSGRLLARH